MIGLAYRTPEASGHEERHDVVFVRMHGPQIHQKRLLPVKGERRRRYERTFEAMRLLGPQSASRRHVGLARHLKIDGKGVEVILDFRWGSQLRENFSFCGSQNRLQAFAVHRMHYTCAQKEAGLHSSIRRFNLPSAVARSSLL